MITSPTTSIRTTAIAVFTLFLMSGVAQAQDETPTFHVTLMHDMVETVFPGIEWPGSDARGLNENGDLIGEASLNYDPDIGSKMQAWVYTVEHGVVALPLVPGWPSNAVSDVSDRDANGEIIIVGGGVPGPYLDIVIGEAALWRYSTVTGEVLETRALGIPAGFDDSLAMAVNNSGTVVGFSGLTGQFTNWKYDIATHVLETINFPARVADLNNVGQICGDTFRGDLMGNFEDIVGFPGQGGEFPPWAEENGSITAYWHRINDLGWMVGRAPTGQTDGAGHQLVAIVRLADPIGWTSMDVISHLSLAGGINDPGDFTSRDGGLYLQNMGGQYSISTLISEEFPTIVADSTVEINNNQQVAATYGHAILLTPLGVMIIPGDVNGDVQVNLDDYCAWVANPIDLNGDDVVDDADEQWLVDRLAVFGFSVDDCNDNGACDYCDIVDGLSLDCDENGVPDECQSDCNGDGVPDVCEPDCNGNGVPDPCDIADGVSEDCNNNGIPDECDQGGVTEVTIIHDPPIQILQSDFIVDDMLVVDAGIIEDLDLTLDIRYRIGDLVMRLTHNDTTVTILDRPGYPANYGGFVNFGYDAIVDDEGGPSLENAGDDCCNFEHLESPPSYRPDDPFSAFDGMPSEGVWSLTITTTDTWSPGEGLLGWGLKITRAAAEVPPCCSEDLDGDAIVGTPDLLILLGAWGPNPGHPADLDGDDVVGATDLLTLLGAWGLCE